MNKWQVICAAEALAIGVAWWALGRAPAAPPTAPDSRVDVAAAPVTVAELGDAAVQQPEPPQAEAGRAGTTRAPPRPALSTGLVSLIGEAVDETGAPVTFPIATIHRDGEPPEYVTADERRHYFLLAERPPGTLDLEITARGFVPWRAPVDLAPAPALQRRVFRLRRSLRVIVQVQTSAGMDFTTWMSEQSGIHSAAVRIQVLAYREPPAGDRRAFEGIPDRNEFGAFIQANDGRAQLPEDCAGALDLAVDPPLEAVAWMGRLRLASTTIPSGAEEVVIRVDENALLTRLGGLRMRVVDAETGAPLLGAKAELSSPWTSAGWKSKGDAGGQIGINRVVPGNLDLSVSCEGYASSYRQAQVNPSETLDLGDVALSRPGRIKARVLRPDGQPAAMLSYQFFATGSWSRLEPPRRISASTDAEGRLDFAASPERHQVILGGGDYGLQAEEWARGSTEVGERIIQLHPGAPVKLRFETPELAERLVWLLDDAGRLLMVRSSTLYGPWTLTLAPGGYLLRVEDLDRNLISMLDLPVPAGGGNLTVTLP